MPSSKINPGQQQTFVYVGNLVPNPVSVKNLGTAPVQFRLTSDPHGWSYYGRSAGTLYVQFPTGKQIVHNDGTSPIEYTGDGIRPT